MYNLLKQTHVSSKNMQDTPNLDIRLKSYVYSPQDKIGKGYSSVVYKGRNFIDGRPVAIKQVDMAIIDTDIKRQLLNNELNVVKHLNHPNILKVHETFRLNNFVYIISEYCDGGDLQRQMETNRHLNEKLACKILYQIVQGLKYLTTQGILHRDIKPANIFIQDGIAKLGDFGFATFTENGSVMETFNVGTPIYMSPEVCQKNCYSQKSDIWALGVTGYEILHSCPPFKIVVEMFENKGDIEKLFRLNFGHFISRQVRNLIQSLLQYKTEVRATVDQAMDQIETVLGGFEMDKRFINLENFEQISKEGGLASLFLQDKPTTNKQRGLLKSPRSIKLASKMSILPDSVDQETQITVTQSPRIVHRRKQTIALDFNKLLTKNKSLGQEQIMTMINKNESLHSPPTLAESPRKGLHSERSYYFMKCKSPETKKSSERPAATSFIKRKSTHLSSSKHQTLRTKSEPLVEILRNLQLEITSLILHDKQNWKIYLVEEVIFLIQKLFYMIITQRRTQRPESYDEVSKFIFQCISKNGDSFKINSALHREIKLKQLYLSTKETFSDILQAIHSSIAHLFKSEPTSQKKKLLNIKLKVLDQMVAKINGSYGEQKQINLSQLPNCLLEFFDDEK